MSPTASAWCPSGPPEYQSFTEVATVSRHATPDVIREYLLEIVSVEGPILGSRLHSVYVHAAGGHRAGSVSKQNLNKATTRLVRLGHLITEDPLHEGGVRASTLRLPSQPVSLVRSLGPRTLHDVPPAELADVMRDLQANTPITEDEPLFREVLQHYGLRRLTDGVRARRTAVWTVTEQ